MDDLVAWIRLQLDEDERCAHVEGDGHWSTPSTGVLELGGVEGMDGLVLGPRGFAYHAALHDPARVLRDVEAKRRRMDYLAGLQHDLGSEDFVTYDSCRILAKPGELGDLDVGYCSCGLDAQRGHLFKIEALPYSDRPGYREEWRP